MAAVLALAALAAASLAAPAAADTRILTRFEMFGLAGVPVLTLNSRTEEVGGQYAVTVDYATRGVARVFVGMTTQVQARGRLVPGSAEPERFRNDTQRNGVERHSRIDYRPDGGVETSTTPALRNPAGPAELRGTVDNLTAYFRLERQLARTGNCALRERVFDGRQGYDLVFANAGSAVLAPEGGQKFSGHAIACAMTRRNWPAPDDAERDEGARRGTIWYARLVPGDLMVPVRMRMDTQLGVVDGFLAELHATGVDLKLMD